MESNKTTLLGTVGYHLLSNHSIGPMLYETLIEQPWASQVDVQEMNWGPIAIVQQFESLLESYRRVVFFCAIERPNRNIGDFDIYRWGGQLPSEEDIQACIGDAVTGVISAENLLIIGEYFRIWPDEVFLFDVEPGPEKPGISLDIEVGVRVPEYLKQLEVLCLKGSTIQGRNNWIYGDQIMEKNLS